MRKILALSLAFVLSISATACGTSSSSTPAGSAPAETASGGDDGKTYNLRASTNLAATSTVGQALAYFVEQINEQSGGRINATANFGSELGNQSEQVAMARSGDLEMVVAAPGTGPGAFKGLEPLMMFEFPFLFQDNDHYRRVLKAAEPRVNELSTTIGLTAMAGQSQGSRDILTTKPVNSLADMRDLVMRGPNAIYISMFEYLGAAGMTMDWNEIYTALSQNIVDGAEGSPSSLNASRFQDNAKYLAITNHIIACVYYFYNTEWYNALPQDLQDLVRKVSEEAVAYQEEIDDADQSKALQTMIDEGVTVTEMADIEDWKAACAPMLDEYRAKYTEVPVGRMFMGGLVPGIIIGLMQMIVVYVMYVRRGYNFQSGKFSLKVLLITAFQSTGALLMPLIILSGIVFGFVTPTESGVLAILYGLFYGFVISRTLKIRDLPKIILESAVTTSVVYMTIAAAGVLSNVLVRLHFQAEIQDFAVNVLAHPVLAVIFLVIVFIVLGMFLDPTVIIAMFATTTLAIGNSFGFDPVHFGVIMTIVMQLGAITPPVGTFLFISCGVAKLPMEKAIKPLLPYIGTIILATMLALFIPQIVTWLPNMIYNK